MEMNPEIKEIHFSLARCYFLKKDYRETKRIYKKIQVEFPEEKDVYYNLGKVCLAEENFDKAEYWFKHFLASGKDKIRAYNGLADICAARKEHEKAKRYYRKILKIDSKNADALLGYGNACYYLKSYDAALKYYKSALGVEPNNLTALYNTGVIYLKKRQYDSAGKYLIKAEEKIKTSGSVYFSLGKLFYYQNKHENAIQNLNKATNLRKNILDKWAMGNAYLKLSKETVEGQEAEDEAAEYQAKAYHLLTECMENEENPDISLKAKKVLVYDSPTGQFVYTSKFNPNPKFDALIAGNFIFMVLDNWNITCLDKFSEEVYWKWENKNPVSCPLAIDNDYLYVGLEKGAVIILDRNTGKKKSKISQYPESMFVYGDRLFIINDDIVMLCYEGKEKLWEQKCEIKSFDILLLIFL